MNVILALVGSVLIGCVKRQYVFAPLLLCMLYVPRANILNVSALSFTPLQVILLAGIVRVLGKGERLDGGMNGCDWLMVIWGAWMVASVGLHDTAGEQFANRLRWAYDGCGLYFLFRIAFGAKDAQRRVTQLLSVALLPLAIAMTVEHVRGYNVFSLLGGVPRVPTTRAGEYRAQGAFAIHILAGTVGALVVPLLANMWRINRLFATGGLLACAAIINASASSGPVLTLMAGLVAMAAWRMRHWRRGMAWGALCLYLLLELVMEAPAYYLMARIDLTGSSTGWHRARLIEAAITHLSEWWLAGTDHTRHWMPTGVTWSEDHTDITNHYIKMGVLGGLPLMMLYISVLWSALRSTGMVLSAADAPERQFAAWCLGAALFAVLVTGLSVSFADQSIALIYCLIALAESMRSGLMPKPARNSPRQGRARRARWLTAQPGLAGRS